MEPEIKSKSAFTVVGMKYRGKNEKNEIPQLWNEFQPRMNEITHKVNPYVAYGAMDNYDEKSGEFDYIAGFEVDSVADIPEGMARMDVPEHMYAVFTCTLPTMGDVYGYAYTTWLPQSDVERIKGPEFELYDENFDPENEDSKVYIYIPILKT